MKVALYGMKTSEALEDILPDFLVALEDKGVEYQVEEDFWYLVKNIPGVPKAEVPTYNARENLWNDLDLFFTFGGDGTILAGVTYVQDTGIPMVGINTGRLGYLAGINKLELMPNIEDILNKNFKVSARSLVSIEVPGYQLEFPYALNELTIFRKETTSMITIEAYLEDQLINAFWCDGLIISTPTGSTGYSLSCNGPIISPNTANFVITPIAPHNLNVRPLVISDTERIRLKMSSRVPLYSMSLDSRLISMDIKYEIWVQKADFMVNIVQLNSNNYLETLRKKLFWGSDRRN